MAESPRARFAALAARRSVEIDLAEGALLIAHEEYPDLDLGAYLARLDAIARAAAGALPPDPTPIDYIAAINHELFDVLGLRGNRDDYYDPRNSYLNQVLDRGLGIPISLSVVYLEVARRMGLVLEGVGMPGHFLVRHPLTGLLVDPFNGGTLLDRDGAMALLSGIAGRPVAYEPGLLPAADNRQILTRMLANLKQIFVVRGDAARALAAVDRILLLNPLAVSELRDRGLLHYQLGNLAAAIADLEAVRDLFPQSPASQEIAREIESIRELRDRRN